MSSVFETAGVNLPPTGRLTLVPAGKEPKKQEEVLDNVLAIQTRPEAEKTSTLGNELPQEKDSDTLLDPEKLSEVVTDLNRAIQNLQRDLTFTVDDSSGEVVVQIIDSETKEVIRQVPREEVLALRERLKEGGNGIVLSAKT